MTATPNPNAVADFEVQAFAFENALFGGVLDEGEIITPLRACGPRASRLVPESNASGRCARFARNSAASFPGFRNDTDSLRLPVPLNDDFDGLADFCRVQSRGVVVDVRDLLSGKLYNDVAGLETGPVGGAIAADSRKFYPRTLSGVIRDGAEVDPQVLSHSARAAFVRLSRNPVWSLRQPDRKPMRKQNE